MATPAAQTEDRPSLRITRTYPVAREKVWRAWTDPQALSRWWGPAGLDSVLLAEFDVREGGSYRIRFRGRDGEINDVSGVYQEVVDNVRLCFSWAWQSTPERVSRVTITLRDVDGATEMDFVHDRFFDETARDRHEQGWTVILQRLGQELSA